MSVAIQGIDISQECVEYQWQLRGTKDRQRQRMTTTRVKKVMDGSWCNDDSHHNSFKYMVCLRIQPCRPLPLVPLLLPNRHGSSTKYCHFNTTAARTFSAYFKWIGATVQIQGRSDPSAWCAKRHDDEPARPCFRGQTTNAHIYVAFDAFLRNFCSSAKRLTRSV
jgi:hypothetical protein